MIGIRILISLFLLSILSPLTTGQSLPYGLVKIDKSAANNPTGTDLYLKDETTQSITPANNIVTPSSAAMDNLNKINHFIVVTLNQETYDAVLGLYPKGNNLLNPKQSYAGKQVNRGVANGPMATTGGSVFSGTTFPADKAGSVPNAPYSTGYVRLNNYYPTTSPISSDVLHGYWQDVQKINDGQMDGFIWTAGVNNVNAANGFGAWDLTGSTLWGLADNFTLFDNFFSSAFGGPLLGHIYLIGGRSVAWDNGASSPSLVMDDNVTLTYYNYSLADGLLNDLTQDAILTYPDNMLINNIHSPHFCGAPFFPIINDGSVNASAPANIADQLIAAGVSWAYYAQSWNDEVVDAASSITDNCKNIGSDAKLSANMLPFTHYSRFYPPSQTTAWNTSLLDLDAQFYTKLAAGTLESVVYVQPDKRDDWGAGDVSPAASDAWLGLLWANITASPHWKNNDTMVIFTWENANGLFDHVAPYKGDKFGPGLRVGTIVASPFHKGGVVNSNPYEHYSIIKMIQQRFNLPMTSSTGNPLMGTARDTATRDFTNSFAEPASSKNSATQISSVPFIASVIIATILAVIAM